MSKQSKKFVAYQRLCDVIKASGKSCGVPKTQKGFPQTSSLVGESSNSVPKVLTRVEDV